MDDSFLIEVESDNQEVKVLVMNEKNNVSGGVKEDKGKDSNE